MIQDVFGKPVKAKNPYIVRHTELQQFLTCQRKWMFQSHNGLNMETQKQNPNLAFGTLWHDLLEFYYKTQKEGYLDPEKLSMEYLENLIETEIDDMRVEFGDMLNFENVDKAQDDGALLREMFQGYVQWSRHTAVPSDTAMQVIDVERRFLIPIVAPTGKRMPATYLAVKLDTIVEYNNGLWILEHKTANKSSNVEDVPGLALDLQLGLQALALHYLSVLEYELPTRGIIYNAARKQRPSSRVKNPLFGRTVVQKSREELHYINLFLYQTVLAMKKASALIRKTGSWEAAYQLSYTPQVYGNGPCLWGCPVRHICEEINRRGDVEPLIDMTLAPREKGVMEMLDKEMEE